MPQFGSDSVIRQNLQPGTYGGADQALTVQVDKKGQVVAIQGGAITNLPTFQIPPLPGDPDMFLNGEGQWAYPPYLRAIIKGDGGVTYDGRGNLLLKGKP